MPEANVSSCVCRHFPSFPVTASLPEQYQSIVNGHLLEATEYYLCEDVPWLASRAKAGNLVDVDGPADVPGNII